MLTKEWFYAAGIRAAKTFFQVFGAALTMGAAFHEVDWLHILSISGVAFIYSLVTSLKGLPELTSDGSLTIDPSAENKDIYKLELNSALEDLVNKERVTFTVKK